MSQALALAMQISANTASLAASVRDVNAKLDSMGNAGKRAAADLGVLKTIEISRVFVSAITSAAGSFQSLVVGSASAVAAVDDLSKRTGVSASALQAYQFAADQSGVGLETFGRGIQKLTVNLGEAQTGNAAAIKSFTDLGLSVTELAGLSPQVAFEKVAAAIAELPNPAQQAAAAVSLFGKSGIDLVPVFQEGAGFLQQMREEAERLGTVLSQDQVSNLAALDDAISAVSAAFGGLTNRVVAEFAPALTEAAKSAATFLGTLDSRELLGQVSQYFDVLKGAVEASAAAFKLMAAILVPLAELVLPVVASTLGLIVDNLTGAAVGASTAAVAYGLYSAGAFTAAGATAALTTAIRGLLASTGIGLLVVLLGAVGAAALEYALKGKQANEEVAASVEAPKQQMEELAVAFKKATADAEGLGKAMEKGFSVPAEVTNKTLVEDVVQSAGRAFQQLATDIGSIDAIPKEVLDAWKLLRQDIEQYNSGSVNAAKGQEFIAQSAAKVLELTNKINEAKKRGEEAEKQQAESIKQAQQAAQQALAERDKRIQQIAANEQQILADLSAAQAEYVKTLTKRNNEPLKVSDVRSSEGISQFLNLALGREDPAIEEFRKTRQEIEGMRRDLQVLEAKRVEIMGGA